MKITSQLLECIHPDKTTCLLSGKNVKIVLELFNLLDIHDQGELNGKKMIYWKYYNSAPTNLDTRICAICVAGDFITNILTIGVILACVS